MEGTLFCALQGILMYKIAGNKQERLFLCKKIFLLRNAYEAIRRISALRREHREGQGL